MKVVSDGPVKTKRIVCPNCCYELEYTGEDIIAWADSDGDVYKHIVCPRKECKNPYDKKPTQISVKWPG